MAGPLLNLIIPILFLGSIGLIIYAIILLIRSFTQNARQLRVKALKVGIGPILYLIIIFSASTYRRKQFYTHDLPQVPGTYLFKTDSSKFMITLREDRTCTFSNERSSQPGYWSIDESTRMIQFYDSTKKATTFTTWTNADNKPKLTFFKGNKPVELAKQP